MLLLEQMVIFFILILIGLCARHKQLINPNNIPALTQLVFNYAMPAIILSGVIGNQTSISGIELSHTFLIVLAALTVLILFEHTAKLAA